MRCASTGCGHVAVSLIEMSSWHTQVEQVRHRAQERIDLASAEAASIIGQMRSAQQGVRAAQPSASLAPEPHPGRAVGRLPAAGAAAAVTSGLQSRLAGLSIPWQAASEAPSRPSVFSGKLLHPSRLHHT